MNKYGLLMNNNSSIIVVSTLEIEEFMKFLAKSEWATVVPYSQERWTEFDGEKTAFNKIAISLKNITTISFSETEPE